MDFIICKKCSSPLFETNSLRSETDPKWIWCLQCSSYTYDSEYVAEPKENEITATQADTSEKTSEQAEPEKVQATNDIIAPNTAQQEVAFASNYTPDNKSHNLNKNNNFFQKFFKSVKSGGTVRIATIIICTIIVCGLLGGGIFGLVQLFSNDELPEPELNQGHSIVAAQGFFMNGTTGTRVVSNTVESFSFEGNVIVSMGATWQVSIDIMGLQVVQTRVVSLNTGKNSFFILVIAEDQSNRSIYSLSIIRACPNPTCFVDGCNGCTLCPISGNWDCQLDHVLCENPDCGEYDCTDCVLCPISGNWNCQLVHIPCQNPNCSEYDCDECVLCLICDNWNCTVIHVSCENPSCSEYDCTICNQCTVCNDWNCEVDHVLCENPDCGEYDCQVCIKCEVCYVWNCTTNCEFFVINGTTLLSLSLLGREQKIILVPAFIQSIASEAFSSASLPNFNLNKVTFEQDSQLIAIGKSAFSNAENLHTVRLPLGVSVIENYAFANTLSMQYIIIPHSVSNLSIHAFTGWEPCQTIFIMGRSHPFADWYFIPNPAIIWDAGQLLWLECGLVVRGVTNSVVVRYIGTESTVIIPHGTVEIDALAFHHNNTITSVIIPSSVEVIGRLAFGFASHLASVLFENNSQLVRIMDAAFAFALSLDVITIPENVTFVGRNVFSGWQDNQLINIANFESSQGWFTIPDAISNPQINWAYNMRANGFFYISRQTLVALSEIGRLQAELVIPSNITRIFPGTFRGATNLTNLRFDSNSQLTIIDDVFREATNLRFVELPDRLQTIRSNAFSGLVDLTSIVIPITVTSIGSNVFEGTSIRSITIPRNVMFIERLAFNGLQTIYVQGRTSPPVNPHGRWQAGWDAGATVIWGVP